MGRNFRRITGFILAEVVRGGAEMKSRSAAPNTRPVATARAFGVASGARATRCRAANAKGNLNAQGPGK